MHYESDTDVEQGLSEAKAGLRASCWAAIRAAGVARFPGVEGRIPNFVGAEAAARRLAELPVFAAAQVLKINPDSPQRPVRHAALKAGKTLVFPVPRLRDEAPFLLVEPDRLDPGQLWHASSAKGAMELGRSVHSCQVLDDGAIPMLVNDISLDFFATESELIACPRLFRRPQGVLQHRLSAEQVAAIPALSDR